jgi:hypothetical protein
MQKAASDFERVAFLLVSYKNLNILLIIATK